MDEIKQIIIMRKDLNMRKGKIAAQACHASLAIFFKRMYRPLEDYKPNTYSIDMTPEMVEWKEGIFKKIVVYVNSEEELLEVYENANKAGLPTSIIKDKGHTEFHGVETTTCIAIGPARKSELDKITGHLPLY